MYLLFYEYGGNSHWNNNKFTSFIYFTITHLLAVFNFNKTVSIHI